MKTTHMIAVAGAVLALSLSPTEVFAQAASGAMAMPASGASGVSAKKAARVANRQLAKKVRAALTKAKPALPMADITVIAKAGVVSLTGSVPSQDQATQAATVAQGVAGVSSVNNRLSIKQPGN
jgi:hyperosmotically inducible periplasmic protein